MTIIKKLFRHYLYLIAIFFIGRLSLFIMYFDRFSQSKESYWLSFLYGLRMDTIVALILLTLILFLLILTPKILAKFVNKLINYYFLIILMLVVFIENATFPFFAQYDVRPNYLFVEYLTYPKEVFAMLVADYKIALLISFLMMFTVGYFYITNKKNSFLACFNIAYFKKVLLFIPLFIIFFIGIRSSFGHRPANISDALYSSNRILNEITKNSLHNISYALYANKYNSQISHYKTMPINEAIQRIKHILNINNDSNNSDYTFNRVVETHFKHKKPKNLVLFIQESFDAQFVGSIGGETKITPNFNRLSKEGILFSNAYANGTRSIRGLAGLIAGNFSIPGKGVLKRNKSQQNYFTISALLEPYGYQTLFIYGGESRFDNMKNWFIGNGFDKVIEQTDFKNPNFIGTWGVSDEDLIIRANQEFINYHKQNKQFATVIFSTSNHAPFDFPAEKIKLVANTKEKSVKNAVKYADYVIGEFIQLAKKEAYYKDTIFVIVADHNVRVYGDDMVPVNRFRIPALILGKDITPQNYNKITTQPDILATALDLLGIDKLNYPILGHSIFSSKKQNISLMQFNDYYALRKDNKVAIIRPNKEALTFIYKKETLIAAAHDIELEKNALAFILVLDYLYEKQLYH